LEGLLKRVNNIIKAGLLDPEKLIMTHLKKYNIIKEIFMLEIELGRKVKIPELLSQSYLPLSFTFYDPIINIV